MIFVLSDGVAQELRFRSAPTIFSTRLNDEFSPVFYKNGIVFCSNKADNSVISYSNKDGRLFKIFFFDTGENSGNKFPNLFSKEINSGFNDGPVTFNAEENRIFFSRNNFATKHRGDNTDSSNKLGIYSAELIDETWTNFMAFRFNSENSNLTTPSLSPDGTRLYFSSDLPNGFGGMDLYYSDWVENEWASPVNLGPEVNTPKNESFPFACKSGKLFFSSDGHPGYGGKDIYYTRFENGKWATPVHLDSSINSIADDFGIVTDSLFEKGYFSTNRRNSDDVFKFNLNKIDFPDCIEIEENNYCYTFWDDNQNLFKNDSILYEWDFGEGLKIQGYEVSHCFPGPGQYIVKLTIKDKLTGDTITHKLEYDVLIENKKQAKINSGFLCEAEETVTFKGDILDVPNFQNLSYYWDIGEGFKPGESAQILTLNNAGYQIIKLGLIGKADSMDRTVKHCYQKMVRVYNKGDKQIYNFKKAAKDAIGKTGLKTNDSPHVNTEIYTMRGLTTIQEGLINKYLSENDLYEIQLDRSGISTKSHALLNSLSKKMTSDEDIMAEIKIHLKYEDTVKNITSSDLLLQEIKFYMKNQGVRQDNIHLSNTLLYQENKKNQKEDMSIENLEFIFMNKQIINKKENAFRLKSEGSNDEKKLTFKKKGTP